MVAREFMTTHCCHTIVLDKGSETLLGLSFRLHLSGFTSEVFQGVDEALNWARNCSPDSFLCLIVNALDEGELEDLLRRKECPLPIILTAETVTIDRYASSGNTPHLIRCTPEDLIPQLRALQLRTGAPRDLMPQGAC